MKINSYKFTYFISHLLIFSIPFPLFNWQMGVLSILLLVGFLYESKLRHFEKDFIVSLPIILLTSFLLFTYASVLWSCEQKTALKTINFFKYYWILVPVLYIISTKEHAYRLINTFLYSMGVYTLTILLSKFELIEFASSTSLNPQGQMAYAIATPLLGIACIFSLIKGFLGKSQKKVFYIFLSIFFATGLSLMLGRAGQIATIFTLIVVFFLLCKENKKTFYKFIMTLAISFITLFSFQETFQKRYTEAFNDVVQSYEQNDFVGSWGVRLSAWYASTYILKEHPFIGTGVGDNMIEFQKVAELYPSLYSDAIYLGGLHSQHLAFLTKLGFLGYFLFCAFLISLLYVTRKNTFAFMITLTFSSITFIDGLFDVILFMKPYNNFFAIMVALALALVKKDSGEHKIQTQS